MDRNARSAHRRRTRLGAAVVAVALLGATATGCAAGRDAQTANQTPAIDGTIKTIGNIDLRAVSIEAPTDGATTYQAGGSAELTAVLNNNGQTDDTLTGITTNAARNWGVFPDQGQLAQFESGNTQADHSVPLPAGENVTFGLGADADTGALLVITGLTQVLSPAQSVRMTFTFAKAGSVTIDVPVQLTVDPSQSTIPPASGSDG